MMRYWRNALKTLTVILREIFDESSYSRFLKRRNLSESKESYARFIHEQERKRSQSPRCC
jgi:hypothetical protein